MVTICNVKCRLTNAVNQFYSTFGYFNISMHCLIDIEFKYKCAITLNNAIEIPKTKPQRVYVESLNATMHK